MSVVDGIESATNLEGHGRSLSKIDSDRFPCRFAGRASHMAVKIILILKLSSSSSMPFGDLDLPNWVPSFGDRLGLLSVIALCRLSVGGVGLID